MILPTIVSIQTFANNFVFFVEYSFIFDQSSHLGKSDGLLEYKNGKQWLTKAYEQQCK